MVPYDGFCRGGPYAGRRMGSYDREQKISFRDRPLSLAEMRKRDEEAKIEYRYGAYRFDDDIGEWHWREI